MLVEPKGHPAEMRLGVDRQIGARREVLAEQPVGLLVGAAPPGARGMAEVELHARRDRDLTVPGHPVAPGPKSSTPRRGRPWVTAHAAARAHSTPSSVTSAGCTVRSPSAERSTLADMCWGCDAVVRRPVVQRRLGAKWASWGTPLQ